MFNLEEFEDNKIIQNIVGKLNKYLSKNKVEKVSKIVEELAILLNEGGQEIPVTYILSILAEENFIYITKNIIERVGMFLYSPELRLRLNSIIILGFAMINNSEYIQNYLLDFLKFLIDKNPDIKENVHYFLQEIQKIKPKILCDYKEYIFNALLIEENKDNIYSLLEFLDKCDIFYFNEIFWFKTFVEKLSIIYPEEEESILCNKLIQLCKKFYPPLKKLDLENQKLIKISKLISDQIIIKKVILPYSNNEYNIELKDIIKKVGQSRFKEREIYFYIKNKKLDGIHFYEIEKEKLLNFFEQHKRISSQSIKDYLYTIESDLELKLIVKTLIKLNYIQGYFSELGFYYPYIYLKDAFDKSIRKNGILNIRQFNYLPKEFIKKIIKDISLSTNQTFLLSKNHSAFYSLKTIKKEVNFKAAKNSVVDIKPYRELLTEKSFIKLIKGLSKDYLTKYRKGTILLTNLGLTNIQNEIKASKILGYLSISKISKKLNINEVLLTDVLDEYIDPRSGIFNINKEKFYYSKFLNQEIDLINQLTDIKEKEDRIIKLCKELDIQKELILAKIDENLNLIGEEIKKQDQIAINDYLEKTGMPENVFLDFLDDLGLKYLKKGEMLIFNENKIKEAEEEIKKRLLEKSKKEEYILLGDIDITSSLVKNLLIEMQNNEKIKGIFYKENGETIFYTEKGIERLMLQDSYLFSFHDLFYGKELKEEEIELLHSILQDLINSKKLKGHFDEKSLTFSSYEILFAQDYNSVLFEFEKMVKTYNNIFNSEFQKVRKILTKRESIFPQEIKELQKLMDKINEEYIRWRNELEAFIRRANIQLLKKQGYTMKKYKMINSSTIEKKDIKLFEDDPEVQDYFNQFESWVKLFNDIELKYGNIIFYQKRVINNPDDIKSKKKLETLLNQLKLL